MEIEGDIFSLEEGHSRFTKNNPVSYSAIFKLKGQLIPNHNCIIFPIYDIINDVIHRFLKSCFKAHSAVALVVVAILSVPDSANSGINQN